MKRFLFLVTVFAFQITVSNAQVTFRIGANVPFSNLSIKISESVSFPDLTVKLGEDVPFPDFTVGITTDKASADFILTGEKPADFIIKASESVAFPDLKIKAGEEVAFPDVSIEILKAGAVDYLVYTDKAYISLQEIVIALLPAINKELDYKFPKILMLGGQGTGSSSSFNSMTNDVDFITALKGAKIFSQDDENTYLGKIAGEFDSESIFNEFGTYGSEFNSASIWNEYGKFGNEYDFYSPFNDTSSEPPKIVKNGNIIGYLTTNQSINGGISPDQLKRLSEEF